MSSNNDKKARGADGTLSPEAQEGGEEHVSRIAGAWRRFIAMDGEGRAVLILRLLVVLAAIATAVIYISVKHSLLNICNTTAALASLVLMTLVLLIAVPGVVRMFAGHEPAERPFSSGRRRRFLLVCLAALGIHVVMTLIGMLIFKHVQGWHDVSMYDLWRGAWMKGNTDAPHYLKIAEIGYVNEGDDRLMLVFFPMLPALIRAFNIIFGDGFLSAQIINTAATCLTSGVLYLCFERFMDEKRAMFTALLALLLPGAIFMNSPMTEPLFMLFTACCFYCIHRDRLIAAGAFTALAGFTRSLGVLLAVPVALAGICRTVRAYREKSGGTRRLLSLAAALVISTLGTLAYLYINKRVSGDPMRFMYYEKLNWSQGFGLFIDTPRYMLDYFLGNIQSSPSTAYSLYLCQLVMIFGTLIVYAAGMKKLPAFYSAYFVVYFIAAIGCTWLLSAVRYLSILLPLDAAIGMMCVRRRQRIAAAAVCAALSLVYMTMYMEWLAVY